MSDPQDENLSSTWIQIDEKHTHGILEHTRGPLLSFNEVDPVDVSIRNLSLSVSSTTLKERLFKRRRKNTPPGPDYDQEQTVGFHDSNDNSKMILDNISLDVPSGTVMAILGGSGSGKTSLLNVISNKMKSSNMTVSGQVMFNGHSNIQRVRHAYVIQQDILLPSLTCRETLQYSASLRLPSSTTATERERLVEEVILELGLKECADTLVGDTLHKGLSGGEKRRLMIGIELLSNPSVLFLDEPTTGLDAYSAQLLVKTLRKLASKGRTLITSIHQPRSDIFFLFDRITLLTHGQPVYSSTVSGVESYFNTLGFVFPKKMNPADFMIDLAAYDTRTPEKEHLSQERISKLVAHWRESAKFSAIATKPEPPPLRDARAGLWREIMVLTQRTFKITNRDRLGLGAAIVEAALLGVIAGLTFLRVDGSVAGIRSRINSIYIVIALQGYLILMYETYRLCTIDMKVFDRERRNGMVTTAGFLISRRLARLFTEDLFGPLLFSVTSYFLIGLIGSARQFFIFFCHILLQHLVNVASATLCVSLSRQYSEASLYANTIYTVQSMACGFFNQAQHMPVYVRWLRWVAYVYYGFGGLLSSQLTDYFGDCPYGDESNPECAEYTGEYNLEAFGFGKNWIAVPLVANLAIGILSYLGAYVVLTFLQVEVAAAGKKSSASEDTSLRSNRDTLEVHSEGRVQEVSIEVRDLRLIIQSRDLFLHKKEIEILRGISSYFEPGKINAILGPSGSGKSSMLNFIAQRLHSTLVSKYSLSGSILVGGHQASPNVLRSICSYVTQDDEGYLPALTVRETLRFAAELRLPSFMTRREKHQRVEELIRMMGLHDCADTLIGSELVKGISGGEKRRVSITVQLLNEPRVLLLDEPTSGLDSFTAGSILSVLQDLARKGTTVICTIHQPRSDLFSYFGNILLLAKGGRVAYSGAGGDSILSYFHNLGYEFPKLTNPADHLLDLISINLQDVESEAQTRERVDKIVAYFAEYQTSNDKKLAESAEQDSKANAHILQPAELGSLKREPASAFIATPILLRRTFIDMRRRPVILLARLGQVISYGIIIALFFSPIKSDYYGVINRIGIIQETSGLYFIGMLNNLAVYPEQRDIFYREHDDGVYGVLPFLVCYSAFEVPLEIINGFVYSALSIMVTGVNRTVDMFFVTAYAAFAITNCGESIGIAFNTLFMHSGFAANVTSLVLSIGTMMNGLMSLNMPGFFRGINWINPLKYIIVVLLNYGFDGLKFTCENEFQLADGSCSFPTGESVLKTYNIDSSKTTFLGIIIVVVFIYRLVASIILKVVRLRLDVLPSKNTELRR
ncbi:P-loop containing nucleoside triphosphate hydrolase protein [Dipodascopsis uninucleata]